MIEWNRLAKLHKNMPDNKQDLLEFAEQGINIEYICNAR